MASTNGASLRNLGPLSAALTRLVFKPTQNTIDSITPQAWPDPSQPVAPVAPPGSQPLGWQFMFGQNLIYTPRPDGEYSAADLKLLSQYPLARICIENTKDLICQMGWKIQIKPKPGESKNDRAKREANDPNITALSKLFEYPDGETPWSDWLRPFIEDLLVIDAGSILMRRNLKGRIVQLRVVTGDNVARYIDENGWTPAPPFPAYAQLWEGLPRTNLTTDQLLYRPRNIAPRNTMTSNLYGYSVTEQIADEIKIGMARLAYVSHFYSSGNIPNAMQIVPRGANPDRILESQLALVSELAGQLDKRRQMKLIQGFAEEAGKEQIIFPKEPQLADIFDDLHIRKVCFGYGTSPQRLMKQMNRASAEQADEASQIEGTAPFVNYVQGTMNILIQVKMGLPDYELTINQEREPDMLKRAQTEALIAPKFYSINSIRDARGDDPDPNPLANVLGSYAATGEFIPLGEAPAAAPGNGSEEDDDDGKPAKPAKPSTQQNPESKVFKAEPEQLRINFRKYEDSGPLEDAREGLSKLLRTFFREQRELIAVRIDKLLAKHSQKAGKARKADDPTDDEELRREIEKATNVDWSELPDDVRQYLKAAGLQGVQEGLDQVKVTDVAQISTAQRLAEKYARKRAAELVGMRYDDNGDLIETPIARYAISDTTREEIRELVADAFSKETDIADLAEGIRTAGAFSSARAKMIARTEVTRAQSEATLDAWKVTGVVETVKWVTSSLGCCDECAENAEAGAIPVGDAFPSGDVAPGAHPNCRCVLIAVKIKRPQQVTTSNVPVAAAYKPNGKVAQVHA